jgi:hypothetical protein
LRTLELQPGASPDQIRQAYLDLVRVWHSDRFQSDPRLRGIAEARTSDINEAYSFLRAGHSTTQEQFDTAAPVGRFRRLASLTLTKFGGSGRLIFVMSFAGILAIPALIVTRGISSLHDRLDLDEFLRSPSRKPSILTPTLALEPFDDLRTALKHLNSWANKDTRSLWQSEVPAAAAKISSATDQNKPAPDHARTPKGRSQAIVVSRLVPYNGLELIQRTTDAGAGEINLQNESDKDAVAMLLSGRSHQPSMAVYVAMKQTTVLRNIPIGVYSVQVEFGTEWDSNSFRFEKERVVVAKTEPLQFYEVRTESGIRGRTFSIVLKPAQSAVGIQPASNR